MERLARISVSGAIEGEYVVLAQRSGGVLSIAPVAPAGRPAVGSLTRTCIACPSQWQGTLDDGRALYVRYRWGRLTVGAGDDPEAAVENSMSKEALFAEHVGDGLDGFMGVAELQTHLYGLLDFPDELEVEGEREWDATLTAGGGEGGPR